jgi:hypothetical protein
LGRFERAVGVSSSKNDWAFEVLLPSEGGDWRADSSPDWL